MQFMNMWEKQILVRAIEIQIENWGNHAFFRDNSKSLKYVIVSLRNRNL